MGVLRVGILTVSDRSARGEREDLGGPALAGAVRTRGWEVSRRAVLPDERPAIAAWLTESSGGDAPLDLLLTTGGTGLGPRDVTPEATRDVLERELPGLAERMRREGERSTPRAALSRGVCGSLGATLVVNLPGSPKGALESLDSVAELLEHASEMLRGGGH